jgi:LysR family hca operon transcriptional activator
LLQVEAAGDAARRAARPERAAFVIGFLTGHEVMWLPETLRILREEAPGVEITLASQAPGLVFKFLVSEPLVAVLPAGHRLAARKQIRPQDIAGEIYIAPTRVAPALKSVIDAYAAGSGIKLTPEYDAENLSSAMSLVASTGGVTLLPRYAQDLLSSSVVVRPLRGEPPTIDLVMGYNRSSTSRVLKQFLARADELVARVSQSQDSFVAR